MSNQIPPITDPNLPNPNNPALPTELDIMRQQLAQLSGAVNQIAQHLSAPAPTPAPEQRYNFSHEDLQDPSKLPGIIATIVGTETQRAIAPMNEMQRTFKRQSDYQMVKQQVKNSNPVWTRLWNVIEPQLDQAFSGGNIDVNFQIVSFQVSALIGHIATTNPALLSQHSAPPAPMIPPSGSPLPSDSNPPAPKLRDLTPDEEIVRKAQGLTQEQYLKLQEGSSMLLKSTPAGGK